MMMRAQLLVVACLLFAAFFAKAWPGKKVFFHGTCTGYLRVCFPGEAPFHLVNGKRIQVCQRNNLEGKPKDARVIRIAAQSGWPPLILTWIAQVLMMEQMQVPVLIAEANKREALHFWNWEGHSCVFGGASTGSFYRHFDALERANADPRCTNSTIYNGKMCAHVALEHWKGAEHLIRHGVMVKKTMDNLGGNGMLGKVGIYTANAALDALGGLSYRDLGSDSKHAHYFKEPLTLREHCMKATTKSASGYKTSLCYLAFDSEKKVRDFIVQPWHPLHNETVLDVYFLNLWPQTDFYPGLIPYFNSMLEGNMTYYNKLSGKMEAVGKMAAADEKALRSLLVQHSIATRAMGAGNIPTPAYAGDFRDVEGDKAWVGNVKCSMTNWLPIQARYGGFDGKPLKLKLKTISLNRLPELTELNGYWMTKVIQDKGRMEDGVDPVVYKDSKHFHPVLHYHWVPHAAHEKWKFDGPGYKLGLVPLRTYDDDCNDARFQFYVPEIQNKLCNGKFQGPIPEKLIEEKCEATAPPGTTPERAKSNNKCVDGACDYATADVLKKVATASLMNFHYPAWDFLRKLEVGNGVLQKISGSAIIGMKKFATADPPPVPHAFARGLICDWIKNNKETWKNWLPGDIKEMGCRVAAVDGQQGLPTVCSGHGECVPNTDNSTLLGMCKCMDGWYGWNCDYTNTNPEAPPPKDANLPNNTEYMPNLGLHPNTEVQGKRGESPGGSGGNNANGTRFVGSSDDGGDDDPNSGDEGPDSGGDRWTGSNGNTLTMGHVKLSFVCYTKDCITPERIMTDHMKDLVVQSTAAACSLDGEEIAVDNVTGVLSRDVFTNTTYRARDGTTGAVATGTSVEDARENLRAMVQGKPRSTGGTGAIGGTKDANGCLGAAGYTWSKEKNRCVRSWEEDKASNSAPTSAPRFRSAMATRIRRIEAAVSPPPPPTMAQMMAPTTVGYPRFKAARQQLGQQAALQQTRHSTNGNNNGSSTATPSSAPAWDGMTSRSETEVGGVRLALSFEHRNSEYVERILNLWTPTELAAMFKGHTGGGGEFDRVSEVLIGDAKSKNKANVVESVYTHDSMLADLPITTTTTLPPDLPPPVGGPKGSHAGSGGGNSTGNGLKGGWKWWSYQMRHDSLHSNDVHKSHIVSPHPDQNAILSDPKSYVLHTVKKRDTLFSIASYWYCGPGRKWDQIFALSKYGTDAEREAVKQWHKDANGGSDPVLARLHDGDMLTAGTQLAVPHPKRDPKTGLCP